MEVVEIVLKLDIIQHIKLFMLICQNLHVELNQVLELNKDKL